MKKTSQKDVFAIEFSKYVLSQIYNVTHGDKVGISIEDLLIFFKSTYKPKP